MTSAATSRKKFYIAGIGMITPVGGNVAMTAAMVNAKVSAYQLSFFNTEDGEPVTMARVPDQIFAEFEGDIDEGERFNPRHDRVVKMAIIAIREACNQLTPKRPAPLVLAMPDVASDNHGLSSLIQNIADNTAPWVDPAMTRSIHSGRASGIEVIDFAFQYLHGDQYPYVLVGGSDCHEDSSRLMPLEKDKRLLTKYTPDAFVPGEAACFLLLTPHIELARQHKGNIIALSPPGIADEKGHLFSEEPYRGDGLDAAFKKALVGQPEQSIHTIYTSMNGENHWAKEYGVAFLRNQKVFKDPVRTEHPADCYGDLGSATATTLIALAAEHLFGNNIAHKHLVYSSSDATKRGAVIVEKLAITKSF